MNTIQAHSYTDAPVVSAEQKYPVLVFAPGYGAFPMDYTSLIEDVASHGYIVAGIVPTYFSLYTVFSDGRVVGQHQNWRDIPGAPRPPFSVSSEDLEWGPTYRLWTGDMRFTLNQLEKLNADAKSPLKGRFDFDRVGVFGHSFGLSVAAQLAKDDARVRAAILLDGNLMGDVARNPNVPKPLLQIRSDSSKGTQLAPGEMGRNPVMSALLRSGRPAYAVTIRETTHSFATDTGLMPWAMASMRDPNRARTHAVMRAYIKAFFDQHLLGKTSSLLNGPSPDYPEVTFEKAFEKQ